jgi:hypothetical protein
MREIGRAGGKARRAGGKARRRGLGERLPTSEREGLLGALRGLDPAKVKAAVEQSLAGGN